MEKLILTTALTVCFLQAIRLISWTILFDAHVALHKKIVKIINWLLIPSVFYIIFLLINLHD